MKKTKNITSHYNETSTTNFTNKILCFVYDWHYDHNARLARKFVKKVLFAASIFDVTYKFVLRLYNFWLASIKKNNVATRGVHASAVSCRRAARCARAPARSCGRSCSRSWPSRSCTTSRLPQFPWQLVVEISRGPD